tara:strand:- start:903 stop:1187 length:285 start_codon:yes stop_codon:yes gene_type:complete
MEPFYMLLYRIIDIYIFIVLLNVILSWLTAFGVLNTYNKFVSMILYATERLTNPLLNPIRRFLPNLGGIDISPVVLFVIIFFIRDFIEFNLIGM